MKEKFKEGTGEQLWTPKAIRKTDTEGRKYQCRQSHEWAVQTVMAKRSMPVQAEFYSLISRVEFSKPLVGIEFIYKDPSKPSQVL